MPTIQQLNKKIECKNVMSPHDKKCASCTNWTGVRYISNPLHMVGYDKQSDMGRCVIRATNTTACSGCQKWQGFK